MAWRSLSRFCRVYNVMKCKYYASMRTEEQYQQQASERKKRNCRTLSRKSSAAGMVETKRSKNGKECRLRRLWYFSSFAACRAIVRRQLQTTNQHMMSSATLAVVPRDDWQTVAFALP